MARAMQEFHEEKSTLEFHKEKSTLKTEPVFHEVRRQIL